MHAFHTLFRRSACQTLKGSGVFDVGKDLRRWREVERLGTIVNGDDGSCALAILVQRWHRRRQALGCEHVDMVRSGAKGVRIFFNFLRIV
ncbi:hypothetical protein ES288_A03G024700v1 [Gossypium darwinii]|uniref:Uncharacterized protein n=1 Tax=Gossypium darwinii TaxID=34276 RepID=A0A5D2H1X1_GOSDA|nr:hypothetical protein ES288_A03G024700v1 [Gossypium darwinii]